MPAAPRALPPPLHPHRAQLVATAIETALADRAWSIRRLDGEPCFRCFLLRRGEGAYLGGATAPLELGAPQLVWLPFSAAGEFRLNAGAEGAAVLVSEDMVFRTLAENPLAAELRPLIDRALIAPSAGVAANLDEIEALFAALARESKTPGPGALAMSALYLGLVMMHLGRACGLGREESDALSAGAPTAQRFRQLVELHYRDNLSIDDFSRLLGVARGSLHGACLRALGRAPQQVVHERLAAEARLRLSQTAQPIEQVAYSLGFRDPAYFNRFFRRHAGLTPGAYRRAARAAPPQEAMSFSAWP